MRESLTPVLKTQSTGQLFNCSILTSLCSLATSLLSLTLVTSGLLLSSSHDTLSEACFYLPGHATRSQPERFLAEGTLELTWQAAQRVTKLMRRAGRGWGLAPRLLPCQGPQAHHSVGAECPGLPPPASCSARQKLPVGSMLGPVPQPELTSQ